jgi:MOSC domain-containing protein YiiM
LPNPSFGENLSVHGLTEDNVKIGDILKVGGAILQISQPRMPCYKVAALLREESIPEKMRETGYTGFYARVLEEGYIQPGDTIERIDSPETGLFISFLNNAMYREKVDNDTHESILQVEALAESWRKTVRNRMSK